MKKVSLPILTYSSILIITSCSGGNETGEMLDVNAKSVSLDSAISEEVSVDKPYYMMVSDGELFQKTDPLRKGIKPTFERDVDSTLDVWQKTDQPMLLYCHGGLVSAKTAFGKPITDGFHDIMLGNNIFPYYLIYDAGIGNIAIDGVERAIDSVDNFILEVENDGVLAALKNFIKKKIFDKGIDDRNKANKDFDKYRGDFVAMNVPVPDSLIDTQTNWEIVDFSNKELNEMEAEFTEDLYDLKSMNKLNLKDDFKSIEKENQFLKEQVKILGVAKIISNIIKRFKANRDHKFVATFLEELVLNGATEMLNIYRETVVRLVKFIWKHSKENVKDAFIKEKGAGTLLVNKLIDKKGEVVLSGSSTGAIYVCQIIQKMKEVKKANKDAFSDLKIKVILIVAACNFELFHETFLNTENLFSDEDVLIMSLSDKEELSGSKSKIPFGSTLYLVSSIAENHEYHDMPILGMERYFLEKDNLKKLSEKESKAIEFTYDYLHYNDPTIRRMILSHVPHQSCPDLIHEGTRHINVVNDTLGMNSIAHFVKYGYGSKPIN